MNRVMGAGVLASMMQLGVLRAPSAGAWTPLQLSGTDRSWFTAKDLAGADGSPVASIPYRLGGAQLVQAVSPAQGVLQLTGFNGLRCVSLATDDFYTADARAAGFGGNDTPFSWFGAFDFTLTSATQLPFSVGSNANNNNWLSHPRVASNVSTVPGSVGAARSSSGTITADSTGVVGGAGPKAIGVVYSGTACDFWINAVKVATGVPLNASSIVLNLYTLGCLRRLVGGSSFMTGKWAEHFDSAGVAVSDNEALNASRYIMREWLIT